MILNEFKNRLISSLIFTPVVIYFVYLGSYYFMLFLYICFAIAVYEWVAIAKSRKYVVPGFIFLMLSFVSAYQIRYVSFMEFEGFTIFLTILFICILTDLGGYIFGKILKGPKLTSVSPKKTISGLIGSFLLPIFTSYILYKNNLLIFKNYFVNTEFLLFIIFVSCLSLISQLGDLGISYFKRQSGIKNSGKIIPGHGGILDRIDGMIFVFLITYIICFI